MKTNWLLISSPICLNQEQLKSRGGYAGQGYEALAQLGQSLTMAHRPVGGLCLGPVEGVAVAGVLVVLPGPGRWTWRGACPGCCFMADWTLEAAVPPVPEAWPRRQVHRRERWTRTQAQGTGRFVSKKRSTISALVLWHF